MWLKVALYQTILSRIRTWAEELILTTVTEWECKEHATLNQQPNSSVDKRESVVRIVSIARIVRADNHRRSKYNGRMVRVQVSYNGADSFRKVQIGPKPWLEIIQWLEIIKNFKDTEHSGNASSPFYISRCFSQFDLGHVNCHHELNPIYAIFRTQNKQGRFIQLNLYRCMYFCRTKLLKLLSSLLVPQSRSRKVKLSLKSTYHPSFLTYKIFLWWLKRNIQPMPQKCFEQLHSWLITHKWRHISWQG